MVAAGLLALAVFTYDAGDEALARTFTFPAIFNPDENLAHNSLGLVGATLAHLLVPGFLGYPVVVLALLLVAWGYAVFRGKSPGPLPTITLLAAAGVFFVSSLVGWFVQMGSADLFLWSGSLGNTVAHGLRRAFGGAGSFILLSLGLTVLALLAVDLDLQKSVDRIEDFIAGLRETFSEFLISRRERRAEVKTLRQQERARKALQEQENRKKRDIADDHPGFDKSPVPEPLNRRELRSESLAPAPRRGNSSGEGTAMVTRPESGREAPPNRSASPHVELKIQEQVREERVEQVVREIRIPGEDIEYSFPPIDLLDEAESGEHRIDLEELEENKQVLLDKLATYNIEIVDINAIVGPTVTMYELTPAPGIKISRITALEDDLAMAMAARGIRMIAPIPGKSAIGVEIPNRHRELVRIRDVIGTARFRDARMELPVTIGKSIEGEVFLEDLTKMPHLLIAGATGSGKSVGLNTLITGLLYACHPSNLKMVMIDPKKIELQQYARILDHFLAVPPDSDDPIITDFSQALGVLKSCEKEMERRYDLLSKATVRGVKDYNKKLREGQLRAEDGHRHLPYIVVIVDELADLMMTAGKDIEGPIARLAQMARAVGIHLVLATQRPSVDVITGLIKANFPSRIAYQVASKVDSRTILDQNGAEGLVGNGDLLYMSGSRMIRLQGPFVSVDEVDEITHFIGEQPGVGPYFLPKVDAEQMDPERDTEGSDEIDELFDEAARVIVRSQQGSVSLLQRKLSIGYARAARIVDQLEDAGIVGPFEGSKARQVLVMSDMELDAILSARNT